MELPLLQSWLPAPEPDFLPGVARFSWADGVLRLEAEFTGHTPTSRATAHSQRLWELGDVAELFVQRIGEDAYDEYQLSPNGYTLALRYEDLSGVAAVRRGEKSIDSFFSEIRFEATAETSDTGWRAIFSIPMPGTGVDLLRISCCRYDAGGGRPPVISSTSPHPVRDFHRPQEWFTIGPKTDQSFGGPS
jgi:hypothetical protein